MLLRGWEEPFPFRIGSVPPRGVVSRVPFERPDTEATRDAQQRAAARVRVVYAQDKAPILRLRDGLKNRVAEIAASETLAELTRHAGQQHRAGGVHAHIVGQRLTQHLV